MKKAVVLFAVILLSFEIIACGGGNKESADGEINTEPSIANSDLVIGTYIGNQGSAITIFDDGMADYYWNGWEDIKESNAWSYNGEVLTIKIDALDCEVFAEIGENAGNTITFKSDSDNWDDEIFSKLLNTASKLTKKDYDQLLTSTIVQKEEIEYPSLVSSLSQEDCNIINFCGYSFLVPKELGEIVSSDNSTIMIVKENADHTAYATSSMLYFYAEDFGDDIKSIINNPSERESFFKAFFAELGEIENAETVYIAGEEGRIADYNTNFSGADFKARTAVTLVGTKAISVSYFQYPSLDENNFDMINQIAGSMQSSGVDENSKPKASRVNQNTESKEMETSDLLGIRKEFKEAMDSYGAFFDKYVAFMQKYSSSSDPMSLLSEYMSYMSQYEETMTKLNEIDQSNLSAEETKYYTEVMARIEKKLLDAAQITQ